MENKIVGTISVQYTYHNGNICSRKTEFLPYPSLFKTKDLTFFKDIHWRLEEESAITIADDIKEVEKINQLIDSVVIRSLSKENVIRLMKKRTAFEFDIVHKSGIIGFWLVYEFNNPFSLFFQPAKRVYQKAGYYVVAFDLAKDDSEIINEVKQYFAG